MTNADLDAAIAACVTRATGERFTIEERRSQGGGCINEAVLVSGGSRRFFVKTNAPDGGAMFEAEAEALRALAATGSLRVPEPIGQGIAGGRAYLVLEAIEFGSPGPDGWARMGSQLAAMHRSTVDTFGWHRDNTIGSTPQRNTRSANWLVFFRDCRLAPQFELAGRNGFRFENAGRLLDGLECFFSDHAPEPSLLHGDLWSGNAGFDSAGQAVVFDPASYYGDRETDLAFSECFGGFPQAFYEAYKAAWPLSPGYPLRRELYNLYHILNHANLFGGGYAGQARSMIERLLRASGRQDFFLE